MGNILSAQLVREKLRNSHIVWLGSKAPDAQPLKRFGKSLTTISLVGLGGNANDFSLESEEKRRIDYDKFSWDELPAKYANRITSYIRKLASSEPVIIVPFAASRFVSNMEIAMKNVKVAGNFFYNEQAFHYKPWVEAQFEALKIPTPTWHHHIPGHEDNIDLQAASWLTRPASSSGGLGMMRSHSLRDLRKTIIHTLGSDISSTSRFLEDAASFNITGCVFPSGAVSLHPLSAQIIGSKICTDREFGYCGNDFGVVKDLLTQTDIRRIEEIMVRTGAWLKTYGYKGAFGLDLMKVGRDIYVSELNARFQASSHLGAELMMRAGFSDVYIDHLAAHMGIEPAEKRPALSEIVNIQTPLAQIFCYHTPLPASAQGSPHTKGLQLKIELSPVNKKIQEHSLLFRAIVNSTVIKDGENLDVDIIQQIIRLKASLNKKLETI